IWIGGEFAPDVFPSLQTCSRKSTSREKERTNMNQLFFGSSRRSFIGALVILNWVIFLATAQASGGLKPPPDGGYAGFNTAEGTDSLFSLTSGALNTANGFDALYDNTSASSNTPI